MDRAASLARLAGEGFDVLVVGGGITGAGAAFDAALRGHRVALVERDDFGSGTSSRSSKLLHGGLRYLQRLHIAIVREGLRERAENIRMAPHLVRKTRFVVPHVGSRRWAIRAGLLGYDVLSLGSHFPRHRHLSRDEVAELAPALRGDTLGGSEYWDASIDDTRVVWAIVRSAIEANVAVANHAPVVGLLRDDDRVTGARVRDDETGAELDVRAKVVVNATGVWADAITRMESRDAPLSIRPSKGIHLVFHAKDVPLDAALLVPTKDKRYVFVIPWEDSTVLVGTTDEDYEGPLDAPTIDADEIDYLIGAVNEVVARKLTRSDVVQTFAGLRPLIAHGGPSKDIARKHVVLTSPGGVVTIIGGKLTAWRPMAAQAIDAAQRAGALGGKPSRTHKVRLFGAASREGVVPALEVALEEFAVDRAHAPRLYHRYGALGAEVVRLIRDDPLLSVQLHPELPYLRAEAEYAIRSEMARTTDDVLARRLRVTLTSRDAGAAAIPWVSDRLTALR